MTLDLHHAVPRCTLRLLELAEGGDVSARLEFEDEALRWGLDVTISREALAELVEASTVILDREAHKLVHGSDWARWGGRGGRETVRRYGASWMAALALKRWGRITRADLDAARVVR
ncbi:MAG: hypothetical protein M3426_04620 [Actinomycetota bacterium]|nr:hypothetical protein [Actinomycetota bacterium]